MKIAITQHVIDHNGSQYDALDNSFYKLFSGHRLRPIPNNIEHYRTDWIVDSDIVVFTGNNCTTLINQTHDNERLRIEKHTLDLARLYNKPIIGIGEGCEFLTTSLGGSIEKNTRQLANSVVYYNNSKVKVNGCCNKTLKTIPLGASTLATTYTGQCKSWKLDNIVAMHWNPEQMKSQWMPYEVKWILEL